MTHMPKGYIIVSRCLLDNKIVGLKSGHTAYWLDLLSRAAAVEGYKGLKRGELRATFRTLAEDWGVSVKFVRCFLAKLQDQDMLQKGAQNNEKKGTSRGRAATVYSIVNYEKYQDAPAERAQVGAQKTAKKGTPKIQKLNTDKNTDLAVWSVQTDLEDFTKPEPAPRAALVETIDKLTKPVTAKRKGPRKWLWLKDHEQAAVLSHARSVYDTSLRFGEAWFTKRMQDFDLHQKNKAPASHDWTAGVEQWLRDVRFFPKGSDGKPRVPQIAEPKRRKSFDEIDWTE